MRAPVTALLVRAGPAMQADIHSLAAARDTRWPAAVASMAAAAASAAVVVSTAAVVAVADSTAAVAVTAAAVVDTGNKGNDREDGRQIAGRFFLWFLKKVVQFPSDLRLHGRKAGHHLGDPCGGPGMCKRSRAGCHFAQLLPIAQQTSQRAQQRRSRHFMFQQHCGRSPFHQDFGIPALVIVRSLGKRHQERRLAAGREFGDGAGSAAGKNEIRCGKLFRHVLDKGSHLPAVWRRTGSRVRCFRSLGMAGSRLVQDRETGDENPTAPWQLPAFSDSARGPPGFHPSPGAEVGFPADGGRAKRTRRGPGCQSLRHCGNWPGSEQN